MHHCPARCAGGQLYSMGWNSHGQMPIEGDDPLEAKVFHATTPVRADLWTRKPVTAVAAGPHHSGFIAGVSQGTGEDAEANGGSYT